MDGIQSEIRTRESIGVIFIVGWLEHIKNRVCVRSTGDKSHTRVYVCDNLSDTTAKALWRVLSRNATRRTQYEIVPKINDDASITYALLSIWLMRFGKKTSSGREMHCNTKTYASVHNTTTIVSYVWCLLPTEHRMQIICQPSVRMHSLTDMYIP